MKFIKTLCLTLFCVLGIVNPQAATAKDGQFYIALKDLTGTTPDNPFAIGIEDIYSTRNHSAAVMPVSYHPNGLNVKDGLIISIYGHCLTSDLIWNGYCDSTPNSKKRWEFTREGLIRLENSSQPQCIAILDAATYSVLNGYAPSKPRIELMVCDDLDKRQLFARIPTDIDSVGFELRYNNKCLAKAYRKVKTGKRWTIIGNEPTYSTYYEYTPKLVECTSDATQRWARTTVAGKPIFLNMHGIDSLEAPLDPQKIDSEYSNCLTNYNRDGDNPAYAQMVPIDGSRLRGYCRESVWDQTAGQVVMTRGYQPGYRLREASQGGTVFFQKTVHQRWSLGKYQELRIGKLCMAASGDSTDDGTPIIAWKCNGKDSQKWLIDERGLIHSKMDYNMCLDVAGYDLSNGANVQLYSCYGYANQRFYWEEGRLLSKLNDKAVSISGGGGNGADIIMWDVGGTGQHWSIFPEL